MYPAKQLAAYCPLELQQPAEKWTSHKLAEAPKGDVCDNDEPRFCLRLTRLRRMGFFFIVSRIS